VEIRDGGSVDGDIIAPRVAIADGAHFRGSVDMQRRAAQPQQQGSQAQRSGASVAQQVPAAQVAQPAAR
jgi:cytoskeletal protein CcmA (bactofilin family)